MSASAHFARTSSCIASVKEMTQTGPILNRLTAMANQKNKLSNPNKTIPTAIATDHKRVETLMMIEVFSGLTPAATEMAAAN